jgi:hypothetical protein
MVKVNEKVKCDKYLGMEGVFIIHMIKRLQNNPLLSHNLVMMKGSQGGREERRVLLFQLAQEECCKWQVNKYALIHCLRKHESETSHDPNSEYN